MKILIILQKHYLIKKHQIDSFGKLNSREFYNMLSMLKKKKKQFSRIVRKPFQNSDLEWKVIYTLVKRVTTDTKLCIFNRN